MSSHHTTSSHNILIAEYTLGLLDLHDMARAHQLLSHDDHAVTSALDWENSLLELTDLLPPVDPSPLLLQRIQATLGHDAIPAPSSLYRQPASLRPKDGETANESAAETTQARQRQPAPPPPTARPAATEIPRTIQPPSAAPATASSTQAAIVKPLVRPTGPTTPAVAPSSPVFAMPAKTQADKEPASAPADAAHQGMSNGQGVRSDGPSLSSVTPRGPATARKLSGNKEAVNETAGRPHTAEHTLGNTSNTSQPSPTGRETAPIPHAIPITAPSSLPPAQSRRLASGIWLWRGATLVFAALALALALIPSTPTEPPVTVVKVAPTNAAILQAPGQSSTPGWIVTFDPQGNVLMSPQVRSDIPADSSVQLWTYNATLPTPRSMGLIDPNKPVTVPASLMGELGAEQYFEMTLEPQGGSPSASPSGPVLFIGRVVTFGAPEPTHTAPPGDAPAPGASSGS